MEFCLKHPPLSGGKIREEAVSLKVIYPLCTGLTRSSQLLEVKAGDILQGQPLLAKIYDPSYWDREEDGYLDPCRRADYEYSKEAAAYVKLQHMQGKSVTRFYGSYISNVPVDLYTNRQVCLVLLEYVDGICLSSSDEKEGPALFHKRRDRIFSAKSSKSSHWPTHVMFITAIWTLVMF